MRPVTVEHVVSQYFASMPTQGVVADSRPSSGVGYYVWLYGNYQPFGHAGMDFACLIGTPIHAMASGTVLYAGWGYNLPGTGPVRAWLLYANFPGKVTVIQHPWGIGVYAHQSEFRVKKGDYVTAGQVIGLSGDTGGVAPHLHVEALVDLSYKTGGGLIYGRTDPSKFFGGLAAQGTINPVQEDDMPYSEADLKRIVGEAVQESHNVTRANVIKTLTENTEAQHVETRKQVIEMTQAQSDVTRSYLKDRIKELSPADLAVQINAAGIAKEVQAELIKLIGGK